VHCGELAVMQIIWCIVMVVETLVQKFRACKTFIDFRNFIKQGCIKLIKNGCKNICNATKDFIFQMQFKILSVFIIDNNRILFYFFLSRQSVLMVLMVNGLHLFYIALSKTHDHQSA